MLTRGDELLRQTIYYPFVMFAQRRAGVSLQPVVKEPGYESPSYGYVNYIDTSAILGDGVLHVFLVNRRLTASATVEIHHPDGQLTGLASAEIVTSTHPEDCNTFEQPHRIVGRPFAAISIKENIAHVKLPPLSVVAVSLTCV